MPIEKITVADLELLEHPGILLTWFTWNDAAYSQMKSSGNLRLFSEKKIIRKIADYDIAIRNLGFYQKRVENFFMSDYALKANIHLNKFYTKNPGIKQSELVKKAGYNFDGWDEGGAIWQRIINFEIILHGTYPEIRKISIEIIDLLNKEYHLK